MKYDKDLIEAMYLLQQTNGALAERMWNRLVQQNKENQDLGDVHLGYGKSVPASLVTHLKSFNVGYSTYNKVQAIKEVRNRTGWGLKESKDAIDILVERGIIR